MKKLPHIISGIGLAIFGIAGSCDFTEHPIIVIPIVTGMLLILSGYYMERNWIFDEEDDFDFSDCIGNDDIDDDITYIEYDSSGTARDLDFR